MKKKYFFKGVLLLIICFIGFNMLNKTKVIESIPITFGAESNPSDVEIPEHAPTINNVKVNVTNNEATLTVEANFPNPEKSKIFKYKVDKSKINNDGSQIVTKEEWKTNVPANSNIITLDNLEQGSLYSVTIQVCSNSGCSKKYGPVEFKALQLIEEINLTNLAKHITALPIVTNRTELYHHDGTLDNGINDDSYRYAGANPNNYVCFGTNDKDICLRDKQKYLYRIIGAFKNASENYEVKLIKADFAGETELGQAPNGTYAKNDYPNYINRDGYWTQIPTYYWATSGTNDWADTSGEPLASLNILLNGTYLTNLTTTWTDKITDHTWKIAGNNHGFISDVNAATAYTNEITNPTANYSPKTAQAKIGLMYVSDYGFAATPDSWTTNLGSYDNDTNRNNNWLYMGMYEWTITRHADNTNGAFSVYNTGSVDNGPDVNNNCRGVRPVFYLKSQTTYSSGDGSLEKPYILGLTADIQPKINSIEITSTDTTATLIIDASAISPATIVKYQYKKNDDNWTDNKNNNKIELINLLPNQQYSVEVKVTDSNKIESNPEKIEFKTLAKSQETSPAEPETPNKPDEEIENPSTGVFLPLGILLSGVITYFIVKKYNKLKIHKL